MMSNQKVILFLAVVLSLAFIMAWGDDCGGVSERCEYQTPHY